MELTALVSAFEMFVLTVGWVLICALCYDRIVCPLGPPQVITRGYRPAAKAAPTPEQTIRQSN